MSGTPGRLLALLSLLQARRDWPGQLLADRLEVSARTVRRDVERLRDLGYPVRATKGPDGGYRLDAGEDLPPLLFDDEQAVALTIALRTTAAGGGGIGEGAARALTTVRQVLPARLRHRVDVLAEASVVGPAGAGVDTAVLLAVGDAVRAREVLRLDLRDEPRRVEPHHLLHRGGRWYLLAWDLDRDDWRTFRLDRITPKVPTGPRFGPRPVPGSDPVALVEARFKGSATRDVWPCTGRVVLRRRAAEVAGFVGDGTVEELEGDRCRVVLGSWSWTALAAAVGRFDAPIEDASPAALRAAFATLADRFGALDARGPGRESDRALVERRGRQSR
ncbi:helix-turn-helix transcriptional regulator [Kineococcus rhizosphaerae]|uniref:HTH domain-containing protein n=1 Tax=Kineococcus rhizosphaerae TaxID=559628 RepID=A0A2T0RBA7_9ACTN|nr:WYL domain-containing protein [Kineococcus rhizosphaerae]PRY18445.1 HTH domain-containing protein [Kineococcus rhizosphaerae]